MPTKIMYCSCEHEDQDLMYGKKYRVHNIGGKATSPTYRCTVCGNLKNGISVKK